MKSASRLFYLSVFALWATSGSCANSQDDCAISPESIIDDACVSYVDLETLNARLKPAIDELTRSTDFFSHYRVNLFHKGCPFWNDENGMCGNIACAVETLDNEEDIPEVWRASELSKLEGPMAKHPGKKARHQHPERPLQGKLGDDVDENCVVEFDDECDERDYCVPEDESATSKGDYVSLLRNPERFTGYGGDGAKQVWDAVYRENCFQKSSFPHSANLGVPQWPPKGPAAQDFKQILDAAGRQAQLKQQRQQNPNTPFVANTGFEVDDECLEKRVFYRVMSGMHASISTHLCWDFLNQTTGEWQPNLACYEHRLHKFPDRISNVYFNYALITRAVAKLGPYLQGPEYIFCTGDASEDAATRAKVLEVTERAGSIPQIFDESLMFVNGEGPSLKEDFRNRFRNVSRLMDCVGCDKCRLWGKLQTAGYGAALKVLFELDNNTDDIPVLKRTELVALFNTYARISSSLNAIGQFRRMLEEKTKVEPKKEDMVITPVPERAKSTHHVQPSSMLDKLEDDLLEDLEEEEDSAEPEKEVDYEDEEMVEPEVEEDRVDEHYKEFLRLRKAKPKSNSVKDVVKLELERFKMAMIIVLKGWVRAPIAMWHIFVYELKRLWRVWLGLPVGPRPWKINLPDLERDEL